MELDFEILSDNNLSDKYYHLTLANDFEDGEWRYEKFQNFIGDNLASSALSAKERDALISNGNFETMRVESLKKLRKSSAENNSEGSELAEICLYGIMSRHYKALPIVPKIFYKQNSNDYAKGADSVHLVLNKNDYEIWLGESKFYKDIDKAFQAALDSVDSMLGTDKLKKENSIITNLAELKELKHEHLTEDMVSNILNTLDFKNSIDDFKKKLHIPIFILHECELTKSSTDLSTYRKSLINIHEEKTNKYKKKMLAKLANIYNITDISFHLILFPIPEKERIRKWFIEEFVGN